MSSSRNRCGWAELSGKDYYIKYHDEEWGVPVHDDRKHFEMLILEGAQAGLSWDTILQKREGYRQAFHNFDVEKVSKMKDAELEEVLKNPRIVRNRLKVFAARKNAIVFIKIQQEFVSFDKYIWGFVNGTPVNNKYKNFRDAPTTSELSDKVSKDLKKRGMTFVGSTIIYSHLQAIGVINDHTLDCFRKNEV